MPTNWEIGSDIHTMEYYLIKINEPWLNSSFWMNFKVSEQKK